MYYSEHERAITAEFSAILASLQLCRADDKYLQEWLFKHAAHRSYKQLSFCLMRLKQVFLHTVNRRNEETTLSGNITL